MKRRRSGSRHPLLYYRRTMNRVGSLSFALGVIASLVGGFTLIEPVDILGIHSDFWWFLLAVAAFGLAGFAFIARFFAYVQARDSYLHIVTPFLRLKIDYRRIRSVRPTLFQQVFLPARLGWAQSRFASPFIGKTVLVVDLSGSALNRAFLRIFLPNLMFSPQVNGLVLLVPDWMALSTDIDSLMGAWLQLQGRGQPSRAI
jgi:hypothetical protein